jgi:5-methylcytosine-specific restriction endonuclease McrA
LTKKNRHIDHIQPVARAGTNDRSNLQLLCQPCNSSKGARDPIVFAQSIGRLL